MTFFKRLLQLTAIAAIGLACLMLLARLHWFLEILTHFRIPAAIGLLLFIVLLLLAKSFKLSLAVTLFFLLQLIALSYHYLPFLKDRRTGSGPKLKVITFNVFTANLKREQTLKFLSAQDADLICLQEVDQEWVTALKPLSATHPHALEYPRSDNFGLLILSKHPVNNHQIDNSPSLGTPYLTAQITWNNTDITVINAHPLAPLSAKEAQFRNTTLARIHQDASTTQTPLIVLGDFNCSAYSPYFTPLKKTLHDPSRGRGYSVTWRRGNPLLGIPIDHLLHSDHFVCSSRQIGPRLGSDHSPIIATLQAHSKTE